MAKFYRTNDASLLKPALKESEAAVSEWEQLTKIGQQQYYDKMQTGPNENGHWQDKLPAVKVNPQIVREAANTLHAYGVFDRGFDFGREPLPLSKPAFTFFNFSKDYFNERRFIGIHPGAAYDPRVGYGFTEEKDLEATRSPMVPYEFLSGVNPEPGKPVPLDMLGSDFVHSERRFNFRIDFPKMDAYWFTMLFSDRSATPREHGPFNLEWESRRKNIVFAENVQVPAKETVIKQHLQDVRRSWYPYWTLSIAPAKEGADAMISALIVHRDAPNIAHAPVRKVSPGKPCVLSATISMPPRPQANGQPLSAAPAERLASALIHYRTADDQQYRTAKLTADDGFVYSATLPVDQMHGRWLDYYFTATDDKGRVTTLPVDADLRPFRARMSNDNRPPAIEHKKIVHAKPGEPLTIVARISDPDGVAAARVYFRTLNQTLPYERMTMERQGDTWVATIPGEAVQENWDLVYYLEAVDEAGDGCFFPEWTKEMPYIIVPTETQPAKAR